MVAYAMLAPGNEVGPDGEHGKRFDFAGWLATRGFDSVESHLDPNAHCPVCGCPVFFCRSPYIGRVFFDRLGWRWPKLLCTDNRPEPQRNTRSSLEADPPIWQETGWSALLSPRVSSVVERSGIRGDCESGFVDLA